MERGAEGGETRKKIENTESGDTKIIAKNIFFHL